MMMDPTNPIKLEQKMKTASETSRFLGVSFLFQFVPSLFQRCLSPLSGDLLIADRGYL
jgi:hypothetical protein